MEKAKKLIWPLLITVVFAFVFKSQFDPKLHISGDNAAYIKLAELMAEGHGYSTVNTSGEYVPASHFPPGYPVVLAFFMVLGINSIMFFKILNGAFLLASLLMLWYMAWKLTGNKPLASCSVLLAVFSPQVLSFAMIVMSEMSFMFFITLGFFCIYKYSSGGKVYYKNFWFWGAIVFVAVGYYIRSVGMAAMGAVLLFYAFRKEWKQMLVSAGTFVLLLLPWSLRNAAHGIKSRYFGTIMTVNPWRPEQGNISSVGEMVEKMINNFDETVIKGFKEILFPFIQAEQGVGSGFMGVLLGLLIVGVVFWGAWNMGRLRWLFIFYLLGSIGLFMLWHGGNGTRYVTPVAPLIFVCFYTGVYYIARLFVKGAKITEAGDKGTVGEGTAGAGGFIKNLPYVFLVMMVPMFGPVKLQAGNAGAPYHPAYANYFRIASELDKNIPAGTVVIARKPELFGYYSKKSIPVTYIYSQSPEEVIADMVSKNADYVVLEQLGYSSTGLYLYPAIEKYMDLFHVVWHLPNPDTYLLQFDREGARRMPALQDGAVPSITESGTDSYPAAGETVPAQSDVSSEGYDAW